MVEFRNNQPYYVSVDAASMSCMALCWHGENHLPFGNDFGLNNAKPYDIIPSGKEKYGEIEVSCRNRRKAKNCP